MDDDRIKQSVTRAIVALNAAKDARNLVGIPSPGKVVSTVECAECTSLVLDIMYLAKHLGADPVDILAKASWLFVEEGDGR